MKVRANYQWKDDAESFERIRKTKKKNEEGFCHLSLLRTDTYNLKKSRHT